MHKKTIFLLFFSFVFVTAFPQLWIEAESGLAFEGYNDVGIPNGEDPGTRFSFTDDFELQGPVIPFRLRLGYSFAEKNHIFGLFAPLKLNYEGEAPFDIRFQESHFEAGEFIEGIYKFNSYRLTYRRDLLRHEHWTLGLGLTAKIRDARIKLSSVDKSDKKDDVGFVPLLHLYAARHWDRWSLFLEGDGLAGGPGRAFDFLLGAKTGLSEQLELQAGYRFLEGGSSGDAVYSFALIHFGSVALRYTFR